MDTLLNQGGFSSQEKASFGEYQVTKKVDGVKSSPYMSNIGAKSSFSDSHGGFQDQGGFQTAISTSTEINEQMTGYSGKGATFGEYQKTGSSKTTTDYLPTSTSKMETLPTKYLPPIIQGDNGIKSKFISSQETNYINTNTLKTNKNISDIQNQESTFGEYQATTTAVSKTDFQINSDSNIKFSLHLPTKVLPPIIKGENETQNASLEFNQFQTEINDLGKNKNSFQNTKFKSDESSFQTATNNIGFDATQFIQRTQNIDTTVDTGAKFDIQQTTGTETGFDINALQTTQNIDTTVDTGATFDIQQTTGTETGFDINALQTTQNIDTHVDTGASYDIQQTTVVDTNSWLQKTSSNDLNSLQLNSPLINENSALQNFSSNEELINRETTFNEYPAQFNENLIGSKSNLTPSPFFDLPNLESTSTIKTEEAAATFGEYQTTTNINDVQSQYIPKSISSPETTLQPANDYIQSSTTEVNEGGVTFGEYKTTTNINMSKIDSIPTKTLDSISLPSVPAVPPMAGLNIPTTTINTTNEFTTIQGNDVSSIATVTPLKGSFAVSRKNKIVGRGMKNYAEVFPISNESNFNFSTYKPNLRVKFDNKGFEARNNSFSQIGSSFSEYKTSTYNKKSHY